MATKLLFMLILLGSAVKLSAQYKPNYDQACQCELLTDLKGKVVRDSLITMKIWPLSIGRFTLLSAWNEDNQPMHFIFFYVTDSATGNRWQKIHDPSCQDGGVYIFELYEQLHNGRKLLYANTENSEADVYAWNGQTWEYVDPEEVTARPVTNVGKIGK